MDREPVAWPDPRAAAPPELARLTWGADARACGLDDDVARADDPTLAWRGLALAAGPATRCFGRVVARVELGFVMGRLELVRVALDARAPGLTSALTSAGYTCHDEHFWVLEHDATRVEVDALDGYAILSEVP